MYIHVHYLFEEDVDGEGDGSEVLGDLRDGSISGVDTALTARLTL